MALLQRIQSLQIEFNHFHPSHLRSDSEIQKLIQFPKNNSFWKFSPIGGVGEFGYTSSGNIDSTRIYDFRTLTEIDQIQPRSSLLIYDNEKLGDYISRRLLSEMMNPKSSGPEFERLLRLVTALELLTPRYWKIVPHLPLPKQEPSLGLKSKEYLRQSHYRYFEIARRYFHTVEKRNILVLNERSLSWMMYLDKTRPQSNSLNKNLAELVFSEARSMKAPKTHYRRLHGPQFESLAMASQTMASPIVFQSSSKKRATPVPRRSNRI
jgi:hypothetical protein